MLHEVIVKDNEILRIPLQCKYSRRPSLGTKANYSIIVSQPKIGIFANIGLSDFLSRD